MLSDIARHGDHLQEAIAEYRREIALSEQRLADHPVPYRADNSPMLAGRYAKLADLLLQAGELAEAEATLRRAAALYERAAADFPEADHRAPQVQIQRKLGTALAGLGRLPEAEACVRAVLSEMENRLRDSSPMDVNWIELAAAYDDLASILAATGRVPEAEQLERKVLELFDTKSGLVLIRDRRPAISQNLASLLKSEGRDAEAEQFWQQARGELEALDRREARPSAAPERPGLVPGHLPRAHAPRPGARRCAGQAGRPADAAGGSDLEHPGRGLLPS